MKKLIFYVTCILPATLYGQINFIDNTTISTEKVVINSPASDFGPAIVDNEFWFSSYTAEKFESIKQGKSKGIFYNLIASSFDESGKPSKDKRVILEEFSSGYHAGPVSYCNRTRELYLTLSNVENAEIKNIVFQKKNIPLKIVVLEKKGNTWVKTEDFPYNASSYSVGHPAVSASGDTLIFASDIPDKGTGRTDLYISVRKNGKWEDMKPLGFGINSQGDEMFPYLHRGKILFYASNGKTEGKGGFDIWYSILTENGFGEPVNLSSLNSSEDDFGLVVHPDEETGFFVSNRDNEKGNDDIYQVFFKGDYQLELVVRDKKTQNPVSGVEVTFSDNLVLKTNEQGVINRKLDKATDYTAGTNLDGYLNESVSFTTINQDFGIFRKELNVEKAEIGQKFVLNNIYYQFNQWALLTESEMELDKLVKILNDNPALKVELGSHTDCRGTDEYNDELSQKRSESAVNYITGKGIHTSRIAAKGYGESQLINQCMDGIDCPENEHQLNRRTEFKILEMN